MGLHLTEADIESKLQFLNGWVWEDNYLKKNFQFKDFREAMSFIVKISYEAEAIDHHPEIFNCYNQVSLSLNTHDVGSKVTEKDFSLACAIDKIS